MVLTEVLSVALQLLKSESPTAVEILTVATASPSVAYSHKNGPFLDHFYCFYTYNTGLKLFSSSPTLCRKNHIGTLKSGVNSIFKYLILEAFMSIVVLITTITSIYHTRGRKLIYSP